MPIVTTCKGSQNLGICYNGSIITIVFYKDVVVGGSTTTTLRVLTFNSSGLLNSITITPSDPILKLSSERIITIDNSGNIHILIVTFSLNVNYVYISDYVSSDNGATFTPTLIDSITPKFTATTLPYVLELGIDGNLYLMAVITIPSITYPYPPIEIQNIYKYSDSAWVLISSITEGRFIGA